MSTTWEDIQGGASDVLNLLQQGVNVWNSATGVPSTGQTTTAQQTTPVNTAPVQTLPQNAKAGTPGPSTGTLLVIGVIALLLWKG